jgi:hypothetical protein
LRKIAARLDTRSLFSRGSVMSNAMAEAFAKIAFKLDLDDDGIQEVETLWAVPTEVGYRIDNIPFYVRGVAWGDIVSAIRDDDGLLNYVKVIVPSGHSTVRLWFASASDVQGVRDALRALGCGSELNRERLVAVDIPREVRYSEITAFLEEKESLGVLEYEEGCIGHER